MSLLPDSRPQLRAGCRLSENPGQENILLIPEGLIKLTGPARKILELCDGARTFAEIMQELHNLYPAAPAQQMERDTQSYLERLRDRGALEY